MNIHAKRYVPLVDKSIRNHRIFRQVVGGTPCLEMAQVMHLGESRIRKIVQNTAFAVLRHCRLTDKTIALQHSFSAKELSANAQLWLSRLSSYEKALLKTKKINPLHFL